MQLQIRLLQLVACINRTITSMSQEVVVSLYPALVRPHLNFCVHIWESHFEKDAAKLEEIQRRATTMIGVMENWYRSEKTHWGSGDLQGHK